MALKYRLGFLLATLFVLSIALLNKWYLTGDGLQLGDAFPQFESLEAKSNSPEIELATLGGGCFWCTEAFFEDLPGVQSVEAGYSGGTIAFPTYADVCQGDTGHAEVVQIRFDPRKIRYADLLEVFWRTHDPTTPNRQGHDVGSQYRSVIFYHSDRQREIAETYKQQLTEAKVFGRSMVTEIRPYETFYSADVSHQDYFRANPDAAYCRRIIAPKIKKFNEFKATRFVDP